MPATKKHIDWVKEYFRKACGTPVLENFLGVTLDSAEEGKVSCRMKAAPAHGNIYGTVHGGTLAALADFAMGVACVTTGKRVVTIDMNISYIKGSPVDCGLRAEGQVVSAGRRIMRAEGRIYGGDQLLARTQASYYITGDFTAEDHPRR